MGEDTETNRLLRLGTTELRPFQANEIEMKETN
jgi:hypothetical protein